MKTYIKNLAKKIASQQIEIESLKSLNFSLEKEKIKLSSSLSLKENTIRDTTSILDNLKLKNDQYENKINDLEKENTELNEKNYMNFLTHFLCLLLYHYYILHFFNNSSVKFILPNTLFLFFFDLYILLIIT